MNEENNNINQEEVKTENLQVQPVQEIQPVEQAAPVVQESQSVQEVQLVQDNVQTETPVQPVEEPKPEGEVQQNNVTQEAKPKKKSPLIFILIIVILVGVAAAVLLLLPKSKENNNTQKENKEENNNTIETPSDVKTDYKLEGNSLQKFDLAFLKLENKEENKVYSPLSIKYALEMLSEGSNGETKKQLDAVIGDYQTKKYENNDNMSFANSMFIRESFKDKIKDEFKSTVQQKYNAEVINDSFENANNINKWVSDKTLGLVKDLVDDVSGNDFYLINALAINMNWVNQIHCTTGHEVPCKDYWVNYRHEKLEGEENEFFSISMPYSSEDEFESMKFNGKENIKGANVKASFNRYDVVNVIGEDNIREEVGNAYKEWLNSEDGKLYVGDDKEAQDVDKFLDGYIKDLNANFGHTDSSTDFSLYVDENIKVFAKDLQTYNGTTLQYIGIMPKTTKLSEYINSVTADDINTLINSLKELKIENFKEGYVTLIEGNIPLFNYEYTLNLMEDLKKLGITDVFDLDKADLSGIFKDETLPGAVFDAKHKATIEFSNDGIRAAAATEIGGGAGNTGAFNYLYSVPVERIDITFDNPYLYLIRDKDSGEIWFVGTVYEPITK